MERLIDIIVSCSNRKKFPVKRGLSLRQIALHDLTRRANCWLSNLKNVAVPEHAVEELYAGDHWSMVRAMGSQSVNRRIRARVWVCSAGYGLVPYGASLKSYRATFALGHPDSVSRTTSRKECSVENQRWWDILASSWSGPVPGEPRRLSDIPSVYGKSPMLVALSSDYLTAIEKDLNQLTRDSYYRDHLHVISCGSRNPDRLLIPNLLPCDVRMQAGVGGARVSLNARIAVYVFRHLRTGEESRRILSEVCREIGTKRRPQIKRTTITDNDVKSFIRAEVRKNPRLSRTRLLHLLRKRRFACEQSRFARLYRVAVLWPQRRHYA